jgi:pimeloyl-ACP methyl ester carboxylesterase
MAGSRFALFGLLVAACHASAPSRSSIAASPCAKDRAWVCHRITVPLDHGNPAGKTIDIAFAVRRAPAATRRGALVTVVGGPGYSGRDDLDDLDELSPRFAKEMDLVRFDLRGVGRSNGRDCEKAASVFYRGGLRVANERDENELALRARTFADACVAEMGLPREDLPFYSTDQAVEDLDAVLRALRLERVVLYGYSYGTQLAQTFAARHRAHVERLVIDGVIDVALDQHAYNRNLGEGVTKVLDATLDDCAASAACRAMYGTTTMRAAFDAIAAELDASPKTLAWRRKDGATSPRLFGRTQLDTTVFNAVGSPKLRSHLQSAIAAAYGRHDFMPLLALSYEATEQDPETAPPEGSASADSGMSEGMYYTFTCNDFGRLDEKHYFEEGRKLWADPRVLSPYYGDLPCAYWPLTRPQRRREPLDQRGVVVLALGSTGDAATPVGMGESTFRALADGYLVTVRGGKHVTWAGGNACADTLVTAFVLDGKRPQTRETTCDGTFVEN